MSVRTLFTSHARYWSVGSLPYLACHLAVCASAIMLAVEARQCFRLLAVEANHPALKISGVRNFTAATLEGPDRACGVWCTLRSAGRSRARGDRDREAGELRPSSWESHQATFGAVHPELHFLSRLAEPQLGLGACHPWRSGRICRVSNLPGRRSILHEPMLDIRIHLLRPMQPSPFKERNRHNVPAHGR